MLAGPPHDHLGVVNAGARLGHLDLDGRIGVDRQAGVGGVALARGAHHEIIGALGATQHDAGQHIGAERQQGQLEQGRGIHRRPGMRLAVEGPGRKASPFGHEQRLGGDVLRPRAA